MAMEEELNLEAETKFKSEHLLAVWFSGKLFNLLNPYFSLERKSANS